MWVNVAFTTDLLHIFYRWKSIFSSSWWELYYNSVRILFHWWKNAGFYIGLASVNFPLQSFHVPFKEKLIRFQLLVIGTLQDDMAVLARGYNEVVVKLIIIKFISGSWRRSVDHPRAEICLRVSLYSKLPLVSSVSWTFSAGLTTLRISNAYTFSTKSAFVPPALSKLHFKYIPQFFHCEILYILQPRNFLVFVF